jgi:hypothetical protein
VVSQPGSGFFDGVAGIIWRATHDEHTKSMF